MYSIQHYVIKFVSYLRHVGGFLWILWFPSDRHDITEILLKVALSAIILTLNHNSKKPNKLLLIPYHIDFN